MQSAMSGLREAVLAGPAGETLAAAVAGTNPLRVVASPDRVRAALAAAGHTDQRCRLLTGAVTTMLILGLCLFGGCGYAVVLARLRPLLTAFNPVLVMGGPVTAVALSQARARLSPGVLEALFTAGARPDPGDLPGLRAFGLVVTAVDGTVVDLAATDPIRARFATPAGGRFPQARLVTLVVCGTRRVLGAVTDSCAVAEPVLWDRLAGHLTPGTLNLADRGFFSLRRWHTATGTGGQLIWRVKNGTRSLPARIIATLPDGSVLVVLRESNAMRCARRRAAGDKTLPRLPEVTARLVEFTVTGTDASGRSSKPSRFRVLTTLLDHDAYPVQQVAACYAERWQVELAYKSITSTLRGTGRRLRGQTPDLVEQEICCAMRRSVISPRFYGGHPKDGSVRPVDLPPFLTKLLATHLEGTQDTKCTCRNDEKPWCGGEKYVFLGPGNGHFRRSNYSERFFRPAADGWYPARKGSSPRTGRPVLVTDCGSFPGRPIPPWPAATPGTGYVPPAGRGYIRLTSDEHPGRCSACGRAVPRLAGGKLTAHRTRAGRCLGSGQDPAEDVSAASWLPMLRDLTPHGLRHGLQTWMDEDGIPEVLKTERMGHELPGMHGVYAHVSPAMRADLKAALQERWEGALCDRGYLAAGPAVPILAALLAGQRERDDKIHSQSAPKIGHRRKRP